MRHNEDIFMDLFTDSNIAQNYSQGIKTVFSIVFIRCIGFKLLLRVHSSKFRKSMKESTLTLITLTMFHTIRSRSARDVRIVCTLLRIYMNKISIYSNAVVSTKLGNLLRIDFLIFIYLHVCHPTMPHVSAD